MDDLLLPIRPRKFRFAVERQTSPSARTPPSPAHAPQPGKSAYTASKAGLNGFAGALAKEVERDGISVHVVTTGPVATPMLDDVHFPMRTLGVAEVAEAVCWLDSLPGNVVLPEIEVSSVDGGPFAPEPFVPEAARQLGRTELG